MTVEVACSPLHSTTSKRKDYKRKALFDGEEFDDYNEV